MVEHAEITGQINGSDVSIVVQEATVLTSMMRAIFHNRAKDELEALELGNSTGDVATILIARFTYPDLMGATVEAEGLDIEGLSLEEFLSLPDELVDPWMVAVYELCPHWSPSFSAKSKDEVEAEKKAATDNDATSASGS